MFIAKNNNRYCNVHRLLFNIFTMSFYKLCKSLFGIVNICSGTLRLDMCVSRSWLVASPFTHIHIMWCWIPAPSMCTVHLNMDVNPPLSDLPPSVFSKLNLHNWGRSCFPFILHNSWGPWQLLYHWPMITHGTPLWTHPWDPCDGKTKAVRGQSYKESAWPP